MPGGNTWLPLRIATSKRLRSVLILVYMRQYVKLLIHDLTLDEY